MFSYFSHIKIQPPCKFSAQEMFGKLHIFDDQHWSKIAYFLNLTSSIQNFYLEISYIWNFVNFSKTQKWLYHNHKVNDENFQISIKLFDFRPSGWEIISQCSANSLKPSTFGGYFKCIFLNLPWPPFTVVFFAFVSNLKFSFSN